jgi:DNA-binding SARP family transcriptional activator
MTTEKPAPEAADGYTRLPGFSPGSAVDLRQVDDRYWTLRTPMGISMTSVAPLSAVDPKFMAAEYRLVVGLLGGFQFWWKGSLQAGIPRASQRLLAFLALNGGVVSRPSVAGTLWPDATERHAYANLRSALARLGRVCRQALHANKLELGLAEGVMVDLRQAQMLARRLLDPAATHVGPDLGTTAAVTLSADLLPGWYDEWALTEAEEWRLLRLHALEALAHRRWALGRSRCGCRRSRAG